MSKRKGRITVTALHEMMASIYEEYGEIFRTVAMPNIGYGSKEYKGTEAKYYESVAWLIERASEENSKVFILGFGPRCIPST